MNIRRRYLGRLAVAAVASALLAGNTTPAADDPAQLAAFKDEFRQLAGVEVEDFPRSDLSGRDEFVALQDVLGRPQSEGA